MDPMGEREAQARIHALTKERTAIIDSDGGVTPDEEPRLAEVDAELELLGVRFAPPPVA